MTEHDVLVKICKACGFTVKLDEDGQVYVSNEIDPARVDRKIWYYFGIANHDYEGYNPNTILDLNGRPVKRDMYGVKYIDDVFKKQRYFFIIHQNIKFALREWYKAAVKSDIMCFDIDSEEYRIANRVIVFDESEWGLFSDYEYDEIDDDNNDIF